MEGFIYKIKIAHKFYYGQTVDPDRRRSTHLNALKRGDHCNAYMQRCFDKHDDFSFEVISTVTDAAFLNQVEQHYIDVHIDEVDCMNIARYASAPMKGRKHSAETKAKMSAAQKKRKPFTAEHRANISAVQKGKNKGIKHSAETRAKISASAMGKNGKACFGRPVGTTEWIQFESRKAAAEHVGGDHSHVSLCITGKRKTAYGWEFRGEE
jgi:group I intron endonuclease